MFFIYVGNMLKKSLIKSDLTPILLSIRIVEILNIEFETKTKNEKIKKSKRIVICLSPCWTDIDCQMLVLCNLQHCLL